MPRYPKWFDYKPDHEGINAIATSDEVGDAMEKVAFEGALWAQANAPKRTGSYANSITTEREMVPAGIFREKRAGAIIIADVPHAFAVEVMLGGGHRTLRDSARMIQNRYGTKAVRRMRGAM